MAAASAGLVFINGLGAITGPVITGWVMAGVGPSGFFLFMGVLFFVMAVYAGWRMTQRQHAVVELPGSFAPLSPAASALAVGAAVEAALQEAEAAAEEEEAADG
jgi:hypothetical protein